MIVVHVPLLISQLAAAAHDVASVLAAHGSGLQIAGMESASMRQFLFLPHDVPVALPAQPGAHEPPLKAHSVLASHVALSAPAQVVGPGLGMQPDG